MPKGFDYRKVYKRVPTAPFHLGFALRFPDEVITRDGREVEYLTYFQSDETIYGKVSGIELTWHKDGKFRSGDSFPIDIYLKPHNK